jgi:hypothetical protein
MLRLVLEYVFGFNLVDAWDASSPGPDGECISHKSIAWTFQFDNAPFAQVNSSTAVISNYISCSPDMAHFLQVRIMD